MERERRVKTTIRFPEDLWRAARIRALDERIDFQAVVIKAIEAYLRTPIGRTRATKKKRKKGTKR